MDENGRLSQLRRGLPAKGIQPRAVLGLLFGGSFAGTWLTHVTDSPVNRAVTWLLVVSVGLLVGGLYWRVALFDRDEFEHSEYCRYVGDRWERIEAAAVWGVFLSGIAYLALDVRDGPSGIGGATLASGLVCAVALWVAIRWPTDASPRRQTALRTGLLVLASVSLAGFAWLETGTSPLDWIVRVAHVGAFSLWVGGAVWHNLVVLPAVRARPAAAGPVKSQARRFRRHLPAIIVLLVASGAYQTDRLVGLAPSALLGSWVGHLIAFKLLVLTVLSGLVAVNYRRAGAGDSGPQ